MAPQPAAATTPVRSSRVDVHGAGRVGALAAALLLAAGPGLSPHAAAQGLVLGVGPIGMTVADASATVHEAAQWRSRYNGGCGAVREACEFILSAKGAWSALAADFT